MRMNVKIASLVIPVILTACIELAAFLAHGSTTTFCQECTLSLILLAIAIVCNLKATQAGPLFGLSLGAIANGALFLQLLMSLALAVFCPDGYLNLFGLLVGIALMALVAIAATLALLASSNAQTVEDDTRARTDAMQEIRMRLGSLAASAPANYKPLVQKAAKAARYASPVSNKHTARLDSELLSAIDRLGHLIDDHDGAHIQETCVEVVALLARRDSLAQRR